MNRERILKLESLYEAWSEHLETLEEEIQRLRDEDREAELREWALKHGLQPEQLRAIPCTKAMQDYAYRNWPADTPNRGFFEGSTCEARFVVGDDLYCQAPRPYTTGSKDNAQITADLILEALKLNTSSKDTMD